MYIHNAWGKMQQRRCDRWAVYYTVSGNKARKKVKKKNYFCTLIARKSRSHLRCCRHRYHRCRRSAKKQVLARAVSSERKVNIQQASTTTIVYRGHLPEVVSVAWNRMGAMPVFFLRAKRRESVRFEFLSTRGHVCFHQTPSHRSTCVKKRREGPKSLPFFVPPSSGGFVQVFFFVRTY